MAEPAIKVLKRHLWYLRPEVVLFSLFGEQVSLDEKAEMSRRLLATPRHYDGHNSPSAVVLDGTAIGMTQHLDDTSHDPLIT